MLKKFLCFIEILIAFLSNCIHNVYVNIIGRLILREFWKKHKEAQKPLERWVRVVEHAQWQNFAQIRRTFRSADLIRVHGIRKFVVFNIGGNKYRLITTVNYQGQVVIIEVTLTHKEYSKDKWKECI